MFLYLNYHTLLKTTQKSSKPQKSTCDPSFKNPRSLQKEEDTETVKKATLNPPPKTSCMLV